MAAIVRRDATAKVRRDTALAMRSAQPSRLKNKLLVYTNCHGRTDGQGDSIICPVFRRAYKNIPKSKISMIVRALFAV